MVNYVGISARSSAPEDDCGRDAARSRCAAPRRCCAKAWWYLGPAFVASVAYMDPGNFATNIEGGARFGYELLWVLLWSNAMAILVQYLAAKLGIATGRTLPENCRAEFSRPIDHVSVARRGNRGHGDRSCGISRRGAGLLSAVWNSHAARRDPHRRLRDADSRHRADSGFSGSSA